MKSIVQIVPQLPPAINALGDYALNLARQLRQDYQIDTHFLVGNPSWQGSEKIEGFKVHKLPNCDSNSLTLLLSQIPSTKILLHYVGYGYEKRGCPIWLVKALENFIQYNSQTSLVTMFHELYASSKFPWHSSFWLSFLQKQLAIQLYNLSEITITSNQLASIFLKKIAKAQIKSITLPVFSNIGELQEPMPLSQRSSSLVVFGTPGLRKRIYQQFPLLNAICKDLKINTIYDIGSEIELPFSDEITITPMGIVPPAKISELLSNSMAGALHYRTDLLAKSTIFASYCAHGVIPIIITDDAPIETDGLEANKHYWLLNKPLDNNKLDLPTGQSIVNNSYLWYESHSLRKQAQIFTGLLK